MTQDSQGDCIWTEDPFDEAHYKMMKKRLKKRLNDSRFKHSKGVAKTSAQLAEVYGLDPDMARMAGLLHDWDKCYSDKDARRWAIELKVDIDPVVIEEMPWLLHGPTAAAALKNEFPEFGDEVFSAIARHTSGAVDMSALDCVVYIADIIEPGRDYGPDSGLDELRDIVGEVSLEELYFQAFKFTFFYLLKGDRVLFPGTADIWNALVSRR